MVRKEFIDKFFYDQPEKLFEKELKQKVIIKLYDLAKKPKKGYALTNSVSFDKGGFASNPILQTIFKDFEDYIDFNNIKGDKFSVKLINDKKYTKEKFKINVKENSCEIYAGDDISVIRAILYVEHSININHGMLKLGEEEVEPVFTGRITRCFFSPTNRPPKNGDELFDDIDYYPENYLNKLMHDGITGIWIYTDFCSLAKTSVIPEFGVGREKRLAKLKAVTERCIKYGIKIYIFCMEPMSLTNESVNKKFPDIYKKYPNIWGNKDMKNVDGVSIAFCSHTEEARKYIYESLEQIFTACPLLGGYVSITQGERWTACNNSYSGDPEKWNNCPRCGHLSKPEGLAYTVNLIKECLSEIKPDAEFISWTYGHRDWNLPDIGEYVEKTRNDVILMQNFEDAGINEQLGKEQIALDYWLSVKGPSEMFEYTAKKAMEYPHEMWAKYQICCSHEIATIPYVPAPGIIFDKLSRAKALNVKGFMESWYFGNYPCLMSRAVNLFTFGNYTNKQDFLMDLARLYWSEKDAVKVVEAWNCFEAGYINYPINSLMGYYGPAHDGVVWDLALKPRNLSLSRSWQLLDPPDGDRMGESIFASHSIDEVITLYSIICSAWERGVEILSDIDSIKKGEFNEQYSVACAINLLFKSARDIFVFYKLRNDLGYELGNNVKILEKMKEIVVAQISYSKDMIELCKNDNRLGYHSEAEGYKFFPKKLKDRIDKLNTLLATEFKEVGERIEKGLPPLEYYLGKDGDNLPHYKSEDCLDKAKWEMLNDGKAKFKLAITDDEIIMELYDPAGHGFYISNEFVYGLPKTAFYAKANGNKAFQVEGKTHQTLIGKKAQLELEKWTVEKIEENSGATHLIVKVDKNTVGFFRLPYKVMIKTADTDYSHVASWVTEENPIRTLGKKIYSPNEYGWIE